MSIKIGIYSMQRVVNFGSVLQAYSLQRMLQEQTGGEVCFMDYDPADAIAVNSEHPEQAEYKVPAAYPPGLLQKAKRRMIAWLSRWNKHLIRRFMKKTLQLDRQLQEMDYAVVGSDEVFNHVQGVNLQLHGRLPGAKRCFTYAAACGSASADAIPPDGIQQVREAMRSFSAVSVRDSATASYVSRLYDGPVYHHLDPVLVGELYQRKPKPVPLHRYLLVYAYGQRIRSREEIDAITAYARAKGLKTVAMGGSQFWCDLYIPASPMRLLDYFYHAQCVVTDTFHGAVFSVLHERPFVVLNRGSNANKLTGLLADLQLSQRRIREPGELAEILDTPVDYEAVQKILQEQRALSRQYLHCQLGE